MVIEQVQDVVYKVRYKQDVFATGVTDSPMLSPTLRRKTTEKYDSETSRVSRILQSSFHTSTTVIIDVLY